MKEPVFVHDFLEAAQERFPDKDFLICGSDHYTYRETYRQSRLLGGQLMNLGLCRGDRAAILLDNSAQSAIALYGILQAGGVYVMINSTVKGPKLRFLLENSGARILITHLNKANSIQNAVRQMKSPPHVIWITAGRKIPQPLADLAPASSWDALLAQDPPAAGPGPRLNPTDLAALIYTSGSTGLPKGVMQPHDKMVGVAKTIIAYLKNTENDVILNVLSLAFGYGMYQVLMAPMYGGTVVLENSLIYLHEILQKIPAYKVTGLPIVPTVLAMLFKIQDLSQYDFSSLRYVTNAGAALPVAYTRKFRALWPHIDLYLMYGLTECVRTCYLRPEYVDQRPDSVGFEIPGCRVFILKDDGSPAGPDEVGHLVIEGDNVMPGYWNDPQLTAKVFRPGPRPGQFRLHTGDLFRRDSDGFLYFVSRKEEMIKCRGERVSALEVENILLGMEGIEEAAVIGIPDEIFGQAVKCFLVKKPSADLTEKEVLRFCSENMENYMMPKYVVFLDEIPKTPNGKVDKKQLQEMQEA
jgi:acyl-CoA synthetase (AMP-forming)/AMP-acid ligase II